MSTITGMTGEVAPAAQPAASDPDPEAHKGSIGAAKRIRPTTISLPTAITAALVAGMFGLLYLNLNSLNGAISDLRTEMAALRGDLDDQVGGLRTEMAALRGDVDDQVGGLRGEMAALRGDVDDQVGGLRGEMGSLRGEIAVLRGDVSTILLDHTDRLARIETHLEIIRQPGDTDTPEFVP